jgi:hypothetical protein
MEYYPRHGIPSADEYGWSQYVDSSSGLPIEPQRAILAGPILATYSGGLATGNFHGKMIMLASTMDMQAYSWSADWYRKQAAKLGHGNADYRLWISDNADHDPFSKDLNPDYIVGYNGEMYQALLDLDAWVSQGKAPAATTNYKVSSLHQLSVSAPTAQRGGIQPAVTLTVQSKASKPSNSITVRKGATVQLVAKAATPPGAGKVVRVEWDFTSSKKFAGAKLAKASSSVTAKTSHKFTKKGTYYVVVRVSAERTGDAKASYTLVKNLARVQVVVH